MNPYLGEIQAFAFGYAPAGWALCDGRLLTVQSNASLFSLIGNYYGGNGNTNWSEWKARTASILGRPL